jgi:hypothetical protein
MASTHPPPSITTTTTTDGNNYTGSLFGKTTLRNTFFFSSFRAEADI